MHQQSCNWWRVCVCSCDRFTLHSQPLALNYDEFEKALLGIAVVMARIRKRADAVDEVLGGLLDSVYQKSGVLVGLSS
jgi:hypothetical protein